MTRRLWWVTGRNGMHCETLTDEQALARILRGDDLKPVGGTTALVDKIQAETV